MSISRRAFNGLIVAAASGAAGCASRRAPGVVTPDRNRPGIPSGVASGDVTADGAVVWSRTDRPARMFVEYATAESFANATRVDGPLAVPEADFTAKLHLEGLPPGQRIFYRVTFQDLAQPKVVGPPTLGTFQTAPAGRRDVRFAWSGDTAGQGYGINPAFGGMRCYQTMARARPDFFIHCGDHVYADGPIEPEVRLEDGRIWRNLPWEPKAKVAETLDEFRGNYAYNLLDAHVRGFNAAVPMYAQWDDHEVRNNWYPGQTIEDDARYRVKDVDLLAARGRQAFLEYLPVRAPRPSQIFRHYGYGPSLELFILDERSHRGPNTANRQPVPGPDTDFLGRRQLDWLKDRLAASAATWKVICSDMPIGLVVPDGDRQEGAANGDGGAPLGRELEIAELLSFLKRRGVRNTVWLTADVHYAAAHHYSPARAKSFVDFDPFWEFAAGPLNAGTFGPNVLDATFGPEVRFCALPAGFVSGKNGRPPSDGLQFFGTARIDGRSEVMTVALHNLAGDTLWKTELSPAA